MICARPWHLRCRYFNQMVKSSKTRQPWEGICKNIGARSSTARKERCRYGERRSKMCCEPNLCLTSARRRRSPTCHLWGILIINNLGSVIKDTRCFYMHACMRSPFFFFFQIIILKHFEKLIKYMYTRFIWLRYVD